MEAHIIAYESMGTSWQVHIWDEASLEGLEALKKDILKQSEEFNQTYSRFLRDSFVSKLSEMTGVVEVPADLVAMLEIYTKLNQVTQGKVNPLIGFSISDLGYDSDYSLKRKETIRSTPDLTSTIQIIDETHIEIKEKALLDLGALGKGYFVEKIKELLLNRGYKQFLVDGSGDCAYVGNGKTARIGLEDPADSKKVIGVLEIYSGAVCASANNRRKWGEVSHTIDPVTLESPTEIIATWVWAENAAAADGVATALFMCDPETLLKDFKFEYCIMNKERKIKRSSNFLAELF